VLHLLLLRGEPVTTLSVRACFFVPPLEEWQDFLVVVVEQTLVELVVRVVVYILEVEQLLLGFHILHSRVVLLHHVEVVRLWILGVPVLDL